MYVRSMQTGVGAIQTLSSAMRRTALKAPAQLQQLQEPLAKLEVSNMPVATEAGTALLCAVPEHAHGQLFLNS